jgi:hypothetical protein
MFALVCKNKACLRHFTVVNEAWRPPAEGREIHCRHCRVCSLYTQSDVLPSHEKNIVITTHGSFFKGH